MSIRYESLDDSVRAAMLSELERDLTSDAVYISPRLTEAGARAWPEILREALASHDDAWIASSLRSQGLLRTQEQRRTPKGGTTTARIPDSAAETLAEGEYNRYYARGLCARVVSSGGGDVEVYRGKQVGSPRPESDALIGQRFPAKALLDELRSSKGVDPALRLPAGPNSGLTIRRV